MERGQKATRRDFLYVAAIGTPVCLASAAFGPDIVNRFFRPAPASAAGQPQEEKANELPVTATPTPKTNNQSSGKQQSENTAPENPLNFSSTAPPENPKLIKEKKIYETYNAIIRSLVYDQPQSAFEATLLNTVRKKHGEVLIHYDPSLRAVVADMDHPDQEINAKGEEEHYGASAIKTLIADYYLTVFPDVRIDHNSVYDPNYHMQFAKEYRSLYSALVYSNNERTYTILLQAAEAQGKGKQEALALCNTYMRNILRLQDTELTQWGELGPYVPREIFNPTTLHDLTKFYTDLARDTGDLSQKQTLRWLLSISEEDGAYTKKGSTDYTDITCMEKMLKAFSAQHPDARIEHMAKNGQLDRSLTRDHQWFLIESGIIQMNGRSFVYGYTGSQWEAVYNLIRQMLEYMYQKTLA